jgi:5-methylcytosine-specific restriction endonuclease McrA
MNLCWHDDLMRKHIWDRDRGKCAECSAKCGWKGWEIHYVDLPSDYPDELEPWKPDNIETLCWKCWKVENGPPVEEPAKKFIYRQSRFD